MEVSLSTRVLFISILRHHCELVRVLFDRFDLHSSDLEEVDFVLRRLKSEPIDQPLVALSFIVLRVACPTGIDIDIQRNGLGKNQAKQCTF